MLNQNIYPIHTPIKSSILSYTCLFFPVSGNDMFRLILMNDLTLLHLARTLPAWNIQECSTPLCLYNYAMLTKTINLKCTKMQHVALIKRATLSDASKMP